MTPAVTLPAPPRQEVLDIDMTLNGEAKAIEVLCGYNFHQKIAGDSEQPTESAKCELISALVIQDNHPVLNLDPLLTCEWREAIEEQLLEQVREQLDERS